jgi:hypothetical protein
MLAILKLKKKKKKKKQTHARTQADIHHALYKIQTHDPWVQEADDTTHLTPYSQWEQH